MNSRERILAAVARNKPESTPLPPLPSSDTFADHVPERYAAVLEQIGGKVVEVADWEAIITYIRHQYERTHRVITTLPELAEIAEVQWHDAPPHALANVELAVIRGHFGVAENAAIWITDPLISHRALPFICQHLAIVLDRRAIVPSMHEAYDRIGSDAYAYGTFIAGPSKTADIEQSLVLGAHGPKTLTVFLYTSGISPG